MQKYLRIVISIGILISISLAIALPIYYLVIEQPKKPITDKYVYPNALWNASILSDMVVENDNITHFCFSNATSDIGDDIDLIYTRLNLKEDTIAFIPRFNSMVLGTFFQIRIGLDPQKRPFIYIYATTGYENDLGEVLTVINNTWEEHPALENVPYNCSVGVRKPVLNWLFSGSGDAVFAFITHQLFQINGSTVGVQTPVIYNGTENKGIFMHTVLPEIVDDFSVAPGDFKVVNSTIALLWGNYINENNMHPYLAINWPENGWELYKLGIGNPPQYSIAIIPSDNTFNVFYYESGHETNISRLFLTKVFNSTYSTTQEIVSFYGNMIFYDDSICVLEDGTFRFVYTRRTFLNNSDQMDIFLGKYDGESFEEVQLTSTSKYNEFYAHCDLSENYFHFAWSSFDRSKKTSATWGPSSIYYYRIPISEIDFFNLNRYSLRFTSDLNSKSQKRYSTISISLIVLVLSTKKLEKYF
ncbi:MAG: hypothetical protein KAU62_18310 [Candidatus Heimdallarchaeota archaeon]|nr:hypothetical protein [Candidatus Heimdallarchaeota archaeon]MCK4613117.1 hypothetical protein [Candidatus Heimdallarchaeota archaeon]